MIEGPMISIDTLADFEELEEVLRMQEKQESGGA